VHRRPKYLETEQTGRERWLISYTDIVTLLLVLFVAAAAQSVHARLPLPPVRPADPVAAAPPQNSRQTLIQAEQRLGQHGLDLRLEERGLIIGLPQAILFSSGEDRVAPAALPMLSQIAEVLSGIPNKVALVGHADSIPIHNSRFQSNWELSAARSLSLLTLLINRYGIPESRLSLQSYGSNSPKSSNDTEAGRAENRRVEILILDETAGSL
jgi:chemotaxis protein MotB